MFPIANRQQVLGRTLTLYYQFVNWSGDATGTDNPLTLLLDTNRSVLAVFGEIRTTNYPTPHWWLAANGYTNDFEEAVVLPGANQVPLWQSYIAGLNPNDPQSQLRITTEPAPEGAGDSLSWDALPDRLYTLWWSTNPITGFIEVPGAVNLPGTLSSFTNAAGASTPQRFYRLEVKKY